MTIFRYILLGSLGSAIAVSDLRTRRIPNLLIAGLLAASAGMYIVHPHAFAAAIGSSIFFAIFVIPIALLRSRSLGAGDSKLIIVLAFLLGRGANVLTSLLIACGLGLLQILFIGAIKQKLPRSIPFAPALILGAILTV